MDAPTPFASEATHTRGVRGHSHSFGQSAAAITLRVWSRPHEPSADSHRIRGVAVTPLAPNCWGLFGPDVLRFRRRIVRRSRLPLRGRVQGSVGIASPGTRRRRTHRSTADIMISHTRRTRSSSISFPIFHTTLSPDRIIFASSSRCRQARQSLPVGLSDRETGDRGTRHTAWVRRCLTPVRPR